MSWTQLTASEVQLNGNRQAFEDVVCMITVTSLPVQWHLHMMSGPSLFTLQAHRLSLAFLHILFLDF